jgi:hypothetical protein
MHAGVHSAWPPAVVDLLIALLFIVAFIRCGGRNFGSSGFGEA